MRQITKITSSLIAIALLFSSMQLVFGSPSVGGIGIEPIRGENGEIRHTFKHVIAEGEEIRDEATLSNQKNETVTMALFSSGQTIENNEILDVEPDPKALPDPGRWVTFDQQLITIPANQQRRVGFTVSVPDNADVGEHVGAILITEVASASKRKGGTGFNVVLQIGAQLVINVPGDVHRELNINKVGHVVGRTEGRPLKFVFNATNNGNVTLRPTLDTEVRGIFGFVGEQMDVELAPIIRGETVALESLWIKRAPYFGRFVANFKFHLGEYTQHNKDGTTTLLPDEIIDARYVFWVIPGIEILYLLVVILLLYLLRSLWLYLVISRRLRTKTETYKIVKGDTLTGIAAKFGVDPRVLAKFNMMRWPYEVKLGDKLLIPVGRLGREEWREQSRTMLGDREIMGGIFGHLFRRRKVHHMTNKLMDQDVSTSIDSNTEILVAEKGDTVADVAEFAGVELQIIIDMNNLRPPYRLRAGQELIVPKKVTKKTSKKPAKKKTRKKRKDK